MLKSLILESKNSSALIKGKLEFYPNDFLDFPKSLFPGEWVQVTDPINNSNYLAYVNPYSVKTPPVRIVEGLQAKLAPDINEEELAKKIILKKVSKKKC